MATLKVINYHFTVEQCHAFQSNENLYKKRRIKIPVEDENVLEDMGVLDDGLVPVVLVTTVDLSTSKLQLNCGLNCGVGRRFAVFHRQVATLKESHWTVINYHFTVEQCHAFQSNEKLYKKTNKNTCCRRECT